MHPRHSVSCIKRFLVFLVLLSLFSSFLPTPMVVKALTVFESEVTEADPPGGGLESIRSVGSVETRYGLVAILVKQDVWEARSSENGFLNILGGNYLSESIETYAQDVQSALAWTKSLIVTVSDEDTPVDIQALLERFYFEGNPEDSNPTQLSGVVVIGDVPLPVVNKNGYRFISVLPYTDFEEPVYILDDATLDFLPNAQAENRQSEVWHGVIVPPLDGQEGMDLLSAYFEKNHRFHAGEEDYTTFDKKVFIGDLVTEAKTINPTAFASYQRFLDLWEEITYYRYTNDLVEDLYLDIQASMESGDGLDNDQDERYDEEAENGVDDDQDGLVDEDLGDGFFGIDNDGDCYAQSAALQDSNGDGIPCFKGQYDENGYELFPADNLVDEDGFEDNNNDLNWIYAGYSEEGGVLFKDRMVDEDPPGDTTGGEDVDGDEKPDGDGCPGLCGVDDNGDAEDHDEDGFPTGWEVYYGYDWANERRPWSSVEEVVELTYGEKFDEPEDATEYMSQFFVDQFFDPSYRHATCYAEDGSYHPEWDDDEDGFCDEDGSTEVQLWMNELGTPAFGSCAYNDADCDGVLDEDPLGLRPAALFEALPDIQAKGVVEKMIRRYVEIFDRPQGVWNRLVDQTGRYETRMLSGEDSVRNDYDSSVSLIAKKDEYTLQYLTELNTYLEERVDEIVKENLAVDIPIIANLQIKGAFIPFTEDENGSPKLEPSKVMCDPNADASLEAGSNSCLQFVNHSGFDDGLFDNEGQLKDLDELEPYNYFISGQRLWELEYPNQCTSFAGTDEEDGQLARFNTMYSREFAEDNPDMNRTEVRAYRNCVPEYSIYLEDIPEVCDEPTTTESIRVLDGAKAVSEGEDVTDFETGAQACFEFRELSTFNDYSQSMAEFNNWLTGKIRRFRSTDSGEEEDYDEFLEKVEEKRDDIEGKDLPRPEDAVLRKPFEDLDLISTDSTHHYTLINLLSDLGYENPSDDEVDVFIAAQDDDEPVTVEFPSEGSGMEDVAEVEVYFDKMYLKEDSEELTTHLDEAQSISSYYRHVEPTHATLNWQAQNAGSPNLPIDASRRVSFIDAAGGSQELVYVNVFDADSVTDVSQGIEALAQDLSSVAGGSAFEKEIEALAEEINEDQLKDALLWRFLSIDEKHKYLFTHYLGEEEAVVAKARNGYEMVSLIADGDADELYFAFNGDKPLTEGDLEFLYRSEEAIEEALAEANVEEDGDEEESYEPLSALSYTTPVPLSQWISAIQDWLSEVQDSLSNFDLKEGTRYCGDELSFESGQNGDGDDNGLPDGADATVALSLTSDDYEILQAGGKDYYTLSVYAEQSDGSINTEDHYTEVNLDIVSGISSVSIQGNSHLKLTGGVATFTVLSADPGSFTLRGEPENRDDLSPSNSLSGTVESKFVKVSSYVLEEGLNEDEVLSTGSGIEVKDLDGTLLAYINPSSGDVDLRNGARAELRGAEMELPTRIAIENETGMTAAVLFLIPEEKTLSVGDGLEGVFVQELGSEAQALSAENGLALEDKGREVGLVTAFGQIILEEAYSLDFDNSGEINLYDPVHVLNSEAETVFTVSIKHEVVSGEILRPEEEYEGYLSGFFRAVRTWFGRNLGVAVTLADNLIPDSDNDLLDDLEEWMVGTDFEQSDTDIDGYEDGEEIFSGYDPLLGDGQPLFTDISAEHEAYHDLAVLYVRGVVKGYADGSFQPDNPISREEFVKIDLGAICKACDRYEEGYESSLLSQYDQDPFPDSDINPELLVCVAEAKVDGIVSGYADGENQGYFVPKQNISRVEATKVLVETGGYPVRAVSEEELWYTGYVETAEVYALFPEDVVVDSVWLSTPISRAEFVMMAVNLIEAQDCREADSDGDFLSDTEEEFVYGTSPSLADTDGGGVNDFDEWLRGSDPLDKSDDFPGEDILGDGQSGEAGNDVGGEDSSSSEDFSAYGNFDHPAGLYVVSDQANYEELAVSESSGLSSSLPRFTNDIPADGVSPLFVRAEIRDQEDHLYSEDNSSVVEFILSSTQYGEISRERVQVQAGLAETVFTPTQVAGTLTVEGRLVDGSLPSQVADIHVYPGEPVRLSVSSESTVLPAGGEAVSDMKVYLYDSYGNLAYNGFYMVTLEVEGGLTLLDLSDEDSDVPGVQVTTAEGLLAFRVLAAPETGVATVYASLSAFPDANDFLDMEHREGMTLNIVTIKPYLFAGGSSGEMLSISVVDEVGIPVSGFQGDVRLRLSDVAYGHFSSELVALASGQAEVELLPGTLAGNGSIIAESAGIEGGSAVLTVKPAEAYELRIRKEDGSTVLAAGEQDEFVVEAYDAYGNLVTTDSSTSGTLRLTDGTAEFGTLSTSSFTLSQGRASFSLDTNFVSGVVNLVASSSGLLAGTWGGTVHYTMDGTEFANIDSQLLYGSLLGAPFGDVTQENYIAGWMTFNGRAQAMTSLVSEPLPQKPIASLDATGAVNLAEDGMVMQSVSGAGTELPTTLQWRSFPDDVLLAEIFAVLPEDGDLEEGLNAVSAELLTRSSEFTLGEAADSVLVLRENSAAVTKVRADGQVVVLDPAYSLVVNGTAEGLGLVVLKHSEQILRIDYAPVWNTDVTVLDAIFNLEDWDRLEPGLYLKPTEASRYRLASIPTGNSSLSPQGIAVVDSESELAQNQQPSLGYQSLESAEKNGAIGWENENKHLLLFAAGNTVGQSNLFYPSEVGIVLGDPTVRLPTVGEVNELGYTTDVGSLVSADNEEILSLLNLDYNGDDREDILVAYTDGSIEVLQNADSSPRLHNRGELLFIENGIDSIDKGDFNDDGLEDLLIVTEEACYAEEMCLYIYENIGGGFVAHNLSLSGISGKPAQVEVMDLNNDEFDDLVIVDENLVLYTVWNAEGSLETVDKVKDFGLEADPSQNLYAETVLRYDGLENGSVALPLLTTELVEGSPALDTDLQAFVDGLGLDEDFELLVDGQSDAAESVTRRVNQAFEYANMDSVMERFEVNKTLSDPNGGRVEVGDVLTVQLNIKNLSSSTYSEFYVSDSVNALFSFEDESFQCVACRAENQDVELEKGDFLRPFVYGPLTVGSGETVNLEYEVQVRELPRLSVMLGQDFYSDYKDDNYVDIAVSIEGNVSGELLVFYSDGYFTQASDADFLGLGGSSYRRISYQEKNYSPQEYEEEYNTEAPNPFGDEDGDGIPDYIQNMDPDKGIPVPLSGLFDTVKEILGGEDKDGDGYYALAEMFENESDVDADGLRDIIDLWVTGSEVLLDPSTDLEVSSTSEGENEALNVEASVEALNETISGVTDKVEKLISMFTCSGGCLALPGSVAFLAAGNYHMPLTGTTISLDTGTPVFGILGYPPVACTGQACYASQVMRLYLAPTTTLGLGLGLCLGAYGAGQCFAFNIPLLQLLGVCDAINGFIADSLSKATAFVSSGSTGAMNVNASSSTSTDPTGLNSSVFESYVPGTAVNTNIQIPGFPSIFTEWWKAQKEEFFKMLDLPDVTFIYPDPKSFTTEFTGIDEKVLENQEQEAVDLDQDTKVEDLTNGVLGLETWLNKVHAFPLIDIQPEKVYVRYPALTREEIELVKHDWEDWVEDSKNEWQRFKEGFDQQVLAGEVTSAEEAAVNELEAVLNEAVTAMETNLAVLESYKEIPEKILMIRDMQAYYAEIIVCYLDAILSHTAGYLTENAARVEAWAQFVVNLKDIVNGWQVLIDLSADLMESCDKCTNQRYSGLQLLFSLFVFIPEFPVIQMPKLPDIVIDVSNIQAGLDIVWPDVQFVPERVNIPELPRLVLPSGSVSVNTNLDINLGLDIPTLPEFPLVFELPELPGLTLPDLPSLPPPPAIPKLNTSIKVSLSIASNILKIVCLIRQGFIPVSEFTLKPKIEEITERPGNIVMPFDLKRTVEWPEFNFDFLKELQINTYLNLTADFSGLYDAVQSIGEQGSELSTDLVEEGLNEPMEDLRDQIQQFFIPEPEQNLDLEFNVDEELNLDPNSGAYEEALQTALAYEHHPVVQEQISTLKQVVHSLQEDFTAWDAAMPEEVRLVGKNQTLSLEDSVLHRYDEVLADHQDMDEADREFLTSIQDSPLAYVAQMRDALLEHTEDLKQGTVALRGMDSPSFHRYLAQESKELPYELAIQKVDQQVEWMDFFDVAEDKADVDLAEENTSSAFESLDFGLTPQAFNTGLYLYDSELGVSTRLSDYTQEADEDTSIVFVDLDRDGDEEVVYSMGGDVYVKENHTTSPSLNYVTSDPEQVSVADVVPPHGSVHNVKRGDNDYEMANFAFRRAPESVGYDVSLYDSLDAQEAEPDENIKRLLLLNEVEHDLIPDDSNVYDLQLSRVWADKVSGEVLLKNAYARTRITSNGELQNPEGILFQTLEDSRLHVEVDGEELEMDVPAHYLVNFGQAENRLIRVESGTVFWIQTEERMAEQNLEEGMDLFIEEILDLESSGAEVSVKTSEGIVLDLDKEELFVMDRLLSPDNPTAEIRLENGAYYTVLRGLYSDGSMGTVSDNILLNPQVCGDDSAPYPLLSDQEVDLAIFATTELSAEQSFDSDSSIVDAYWDLDSTVDADGDGVPNNDEEVIGLEAEIGPYPDPNPRLVTLTVTDAAGNSATGEVTVNVYVPAIELTEATVDHVVGRTNPLSPELPFTLIRDRQGALSELGNYRTNEDGTLDEEMISSNLLAVYDADGEVIAEFNPISKQVLVYDPAYEVTVLSSDANWPSRLAVYEKASGLVMGSFIFVADAEQNIVRLSEPLESFDLSLYDQVVVYPVSGENNYEWTASTVTARDDYGSLEFMLSQNGNITVFDSSYTLVKRAADSLEDYLIIEVYRDGVLELEVWPGSSMETYLVDTQAMGLPSSSLISEDHDSLSADTHLYFEDISTDDPLYEDIAELVERGVLEGYEVGDERYFKPEQAINRAEFTKIVLAILCIIPRDEAELLPSVFTDILDLELWYFAYTKEAFLQNLITGYLGEVNAQGVAPFKPNNTITRAEAAKILLEALEQQDIITLPENLSGVAWYDPYMEIAQDLEPYMNTATTAGENNFILSPEEAVDPNHEITRYEFVEMSVRVLQAYNCFDLDSDGDGLVNYEEDSLYGSDPYNPDTDSGGVDDGTEVGRSSDPLNGEDDFDDATVIQNAEPGIYVVAEQCSACPCSSFIDYLADIRPGDEVFAIIQNEEGEIFGVSNVLTVSE